MNEDEIQLTPESHAFLSQHMTRAASPRVLRDLDRSLSGRNGGSARQGALRNLIAGARTAMANGRSHAAVVGDLRMSDFLPALPGTSARAFSLRDLQRPAGEATYSAAILAESLVARAGTKLIFMPEPQAVAGGESIQAFYQRPSRYQVVTAANFAAVADGADVAPSELPLLSAEFGAEYGDASDAWRVEISRADQKSMHQDDLEFVISQAIIRGYAKQIDKRVLSAIVATTPGAWSLAAAAAHGLRFGECRAVIGSTAAGASVGADGVLRAGGLSAELTDVVTLTIAGAFYRAGCALENELRVLIERRDVQGTLVVTVFATMQPVIADPDAFFAVSA
jgi:hypothetical protein